MTIMIAATLIFSGLVIAAYQICEAIFKVREAIDRNTDAILTDYVEIIDGQRDISKG